MTSWNPGEQPEGQQPPPYGQQPPQYGGGQQPPQYGQQPPPQYGQQPPSQYGQPQYGGGAYPPAPQNNQYGPPTQGLPPGAVRPLSMSNRVVAFIIDYAIFVVLGIIIYAVAIGSIFAAASTGCSTDSNGQLDCSGGAGVGAGVVILFLFLLLLELAIAVYWIYLLGKTGQTPGKKIMGVKVVDFSTGQTIGFGRAFLRYLVQGLCNILCYAGLWSAFLDGPPQGQYRGWHDKAINSVVISVK